MVERSQWSGRRGRLLNGIRDLFARAVSVPALQGNANRSFYTVGKSQYLNTQVENSRHSVYDGSGVKETIFNAH